MGVTRWIYQITKTGFERLVRIMGLVALIRQCEIVRGVAGDAVGFTGPFAEVNKFAALAAKRSPRIVG